jgi:hypothetical protein
MGDGNGAARFRIGFAMEQNLGHRTHYRILGHVAEEVPVGAARAALPPARRA